MQATVYKDAYSGSWTPTMWWSKLAQEEGSLKDNEWSTLKSIEMQATVYNDAYSWNCIRAMWWNEVAVEEQSHDDNERSTL